MPSSATTRNRLEKMAAGENLNTWGDPHLNTDFDLIDQAMDGWTTKALTADVALTSINYAADEARNRVLKFTGAGPFVVTIPSVEKVYVLWNACTAALTLSTGGGVNVVLGANELALVFCDGANVYQLGYDGLSIKAYIDAQAWAASSGILPGQPTNGGKFLKTDGATPSWAYPTTDAIADFATKTAIATGLAIAFAISF